MGSSGEGEMCHTWRRRCSCSSMSNFSCACSSLITRVASAVLLSRSLSLLLSSTNPRQKLSTMMLPSIPQRLMTLSNIAFISSSSITSNWEIGRAEGGGYAGRGGEEWWCKLEGEGETTWRRIGCSAEGVEGKGSDMGRVEGEEED